MSLGGLLALPLLVFLPGAAVARAMAAPREPSGRWEGLAPLPAVVGSIALTSLVGLALADLGLFSLGRLCVALAVLAMLAGLTATLRGPTPSPVATGRTAAVGLVAALLAGGLYLPGFDTSIMASDASFYRAAGMHLARHGSLAIDDPLLGELPAGQSGLLFSKNVYGGWARVPGGLIMAMPDARVVHPSFEHLLPVWMAIAHAIGGLTVVDGVGPFFAWLALWAIAVFALELDGAFAAIVVAALLATNLAEWFYARFLMPEVPMQAILWGGLLAFETWWREGGRAPATIAALALGTTALARVEGMILVPLALALHLGWNAHRPSGSRAFAAIYGAVIVWAVARFLVVPTHYRDALRAHLMLAWTTASHAGPALPLAIAVGVVALVVARRWLPARRVAVAAAALVAAALFALRSPPMVGTALVWLAETSSWVTLAAALGGFAVLSGRPERPRFALVVLAVLGLPFLWNPHVTPDQLWGVRRFVPVVVPWTMLAVACLMATAVRRRAIAVLVAGALLVSSARPMWTLRALPFFPSQAKALGDLAASIPDGAVVFVAPELTAYLVHLPLWTTYDREPFVLSPIGPQRALSVVVPGLAARHPVVLLANRLGPAPVVPGLDVRPRADADLTTLTPELDPLRAPTRPTAHRVPLRVYDLVVAPVR